MELDKDVTAIFSALYFSISEEDVQAIDFLLRVNLGCKWPKLEPLTIKAVLLKMMDLGMLKVDKECGECNLSELVLLLDGIGQRKLSADVRESGWWSNHRVF